MKIITQTEHNGHTIKLTRADIARQKRARAFYAVTESKEKRS